MLQVVRRLHSAEHCLHLGWDFQQTLKHWFSLSPSGKEKLITSMEQISAARSWLLSSAVWQGRSGEWNRGCWGPNPRQKNGSPSSHLSSLEKNSAPALSPSYGAHHDWKVGTCKICVKIHSWTKLKMMADRIYFHQTPVFKGNFTITTRPCPVFAQKFKYKAFFTLSSWTVLCQKTSWCSSMQQSQRASLQHNLVVK